MDKWQKYLEEATAKFSKSLEDDFEGEVDYDGSRCDNSERLLENIIENLDLDEDDEEFYSDIEDFIYDNIQFDKMVDERWEEYEEPSDLEEFGRYWE